MPLSTGREERGEDWEELANVKKGDCCREKRVGRMDVGRRVESPMLLTELKLSLTSFFVPAFHDKDDVNCL